MDSAYLLIIDHSPECAEEINSLLRNSGIDVHTLFASSTAEAEKIIKSKSILLLIYHASAPKSAPVSKILQLAEKYKLAAAVRFAPDDPAVLVEALTFHSCLAINSEDDSLLINLIRKLRENGQSAHDYADMKSKLDELQHRYNLLLDTSRESIAYIHQGLHVYANRAYLGLLQVENFAEIEADSLLEFMHGEHDDLKTLFRRMNKGEFPAEAVNVTINTHAGSTFQADLVFSAARYDGEDCIQMMVQEKDAQTLLKDELDRLRLTDPLTQMANRKNFNQTLSTFIESGQTDTFDSAVIYLEPDGIQALHAKLGVAGLDGFITSFAGVVRDCIEEDDLAARVSDNGFAILVKRDDKSSLLSVGESIVSNFSRHNVELGDQAISVTCSVGMATIGALTRSADEVFEHAQSAFASASKEGNCLKRYKPGLSSIAPDEQDRQWIERIRYALDNQNLYSVQQSIVNLEGESSEGLFENKTYMREEDGDLPSDEFMPIAERNDLGSNIDRHVIPGLMKAIAGTGDRHIIILSANSLIDFSFPSWFRNQLHELGVQGSQIILQFSAPSAQLNLKSSRRLIDELKPAGCHFSLSSFDDRQRICTLLDHLDVSLVKLNPNLTHDLRQNSASQSVVRNVVRKADSAQVNVIADEIRNAEDLAVLWQCGVKLVAGDFLNEAPQVVGQ